MKTKCETCDFLYECIEAHKVEEIEKAGKTEYVKDENAICFAEFRRRTQRFFEGDFFR